MFSDHYKLLPVDLRDIQNLNAIIALADMDPRYVLGVLRLSRTAMSFYCHLDKYYRKQHLILEVLKLKFILV